MSKNMDKTRCSTTSEQDTQPSVEGFTPGPWAVLPNTGMFSGAVVAPAGDAELGNWMVAERVRWPGDANLIAAAPDLYGALKAIIRYGELGCVDVGASYTGGKKPATMDVWQFPRHLLNRVEAALRAAVPQTVLGTNAQASNTDSYPNTTSAPETDPGR